MQQIARFLMVICVRKSAVIYTAQRCAVGIRDFLSGSLGRPFSLFFPRCESLTGLPLFNNGKPRLGIPKCLVIILDMFKWLFPLLCPKSYPCLASFIISCGRHRRILRGLLPLVAATEPFPNDAGPRHPRAPPMSDTDPLAPAVSLRSFPPFALVAVGGPQVV